MRWRPVYSAVPAVGTRGNGLKLRQGRCRLGIRISFSSVGVVRHWNKVPREVADSPALEVFKEYLDLVLGDVVQGLQ